MMAWQSLVEIKRNKTSRSLIFICYCFLLITLTIAESSPDYGEPDDFQQSNNSGTGNSENSNNEEIYEPNLLQQEVEKEQEKSLENSAMDIDDYHQMPENDNQTHKQINQLSSQENLIESMQQEDDESSYPQKESNHTSKDLQGYENDSLYSITPRSPSTLTTTGPKKHLNLGSDEILDPDASISEYMEDESYFSSLEKQNKLQSSMVPPTETTSLPSEKREEIKTDEFIPIPMKFFQSIQQTKKNLMNFDDSLNKNKTQHFSQASQMVSSSEEEYYEDSREMESKNPTTAEPLADDSTYSPLVEKVLSQEVPIIAKGALGMGVNLYRTSAKTTTITPETSTTTKAPKLPSSRSLFPTEEKAATIPSSFGYFPSEPTEKPENQEDEVPTLSTTSTPPTATNSVSASSTTFTTTTPSSVSLSTTPPVTTVRPKQGKQIKILPRRKLLPHEQLHNYIEDAYIRTPLAVIVDPSAECLDKTKILWNEALRTNLNIKIILVSLNASGIPASYNFNNSRQFLSGLNTIKEHDGGDSFVGILHAAELVPYDSAVYVSTAEVPRYTELVQDAAITLLKKRIRLYVIWYGEKSSSENETHDNIGGILGEVAIRSGGEVLHIVGNENSQEIEGNTLTLVADAFRGSQEVEIPVETTLSSLHVKIDASMRKATLETPYGDINLKKMVKFKSVYTNFDNDKNRLDSYVPLTKLRKSSVFTLKLVPESMENEYTVFIRGERKSDFLLDDVVRRFEEYFMFGSSSYPARYRNNRLPNNKLIPYKLKKTKDTHEDLKFPETSPNDNDENDIDALGPKSQFETFTDTEIQMKTKMENFSSSSFDVDFVDVKASNIFQPHKGLKIEMSTRSQILVSPGTTSQLFFEMTNLRDEAVYHTIRVLDERSYLLSLVPKSVFIMPGKTVTVTLTVIIPTDAPQGTTDRISFSTSARNDDISSITVILRVSNINEVRDTSAPTLTWDFGSRCDYINTDSPNCADRFWSLDILAQDTQSGILRLQSSPSGLWYRNPITIGSSEPMKATYLATCCEPRVSLTVHDVAGNQRTYNVDVRDFVLTEASIAAIVLGSLLLLIVIIIIIVSIVWCCRRRQTTINLPTYRSHSTRSME